MAKVIYNSKTGLRIPASKFLWNWHADESLLPALMEQFPELSIEDDEPVVAEVVEEAPAEFDWDEGPNEEGSEDPFVD